MTANKGWFTQYRLLNIIMIMLQDSYWKHGIGILRVPFIAYEANLSDITAKELPFLATVIELVS